MIINLIEYSSKRQLIPKKLVKFAIRFQPYHNLVLSIFSAVLVTSTLATSVLISLNYLSLKEASYILCPLRKESVKGITGIHQYIFYLSKYWELFDTILQNIKGRRPPSYYFHVWHHSCYLMFCWAYCKYSVSLSYASVFVNGFVHVIMYYYYYLVSLGRSVPWKSKITRIQIVQFITGYAYFLVTLKKIYIDKQNCNGQAVLWLHAMFNFTMLMGFIRILQRILISPVKKQKLT